MNSSYSIEPIAYIHNDFSEKFGIPRQSMLVPQLISTIVFEPEFRNPQAFKGLEDYSHLWLIWNFSQSNNHPWSPTVRPPRLGGNEKMGVFATRSPFRPNHLGLSCVGLDHIEFTKDLGPVLYVTGADLMNGTPIFDIKPYLAFTDSHPNASHGFAGPVKDYHLTVYCPSQWKELISPEDCSIIFKLIEQDPRPSYQNDEQRIYGLTYGDYNIQFTVNEHTATICNITLIK